MPTNTSERQKLTGEVFIPPELAEEITSRVKNLPQLQAQIQNAIAQGTTQLLNVLLVSALSLDASDIHMEPEKAGLKIRLRIDGLLHDILVLPQSISGSFVSRVKLVSGVKINVVEKPQDGRFSFAFRQGPPIETRVSTLPAEYGESIVLRILNPKHLIMLKDLGLRTNALQIMKTELKKPNGMVIATGPTGSGKTTTLYAFLKEIKNPEVKIVTIEDPIEYHLEGISQTQVRPEKGYDFASGLQAIVRQDPDVLLIGEIRDKATAQISIQAALTGHLVFTTLHTNDAPGTISRLISLGAKPINIGAATNVIVGQRLIRKVCIKCVILHNISSSELKKIKAGLQKIEETSQILVSSALKIAQAKGCAACNNTGYRGRVGIFELIVVNSTMEEFILSNPSTSALRKFAIQQGMVPMYQDGLLKVLEGITTLEEIIRITGEYK